MFECLGLSLPLSLSLFLDTGVRTARKRHREGSTEPLATDVSNPFLLGPSNDVTP